MSPSTEATLERPPTREVVFSARVPAPLGTYSQGVRVGETVFLAAQTPVIPGTNDIAAGGFEGQVRQTFSNLRAMVEDCGATLADVVKVTVYITEIEKFALMNSIMAEYFKPPYPARTTVGAASLARGTLVAVDAIVALRDAA